MIEMENMHITMVISVPTCVRNTDRKFAISNELQYCLCFHISLRNIIQIKHS